MISYTRCVETPIGKILLESDGKAITGLHFSAQLDHRSVDQSCDELLAQAQLQIEQYFKGERTSFDLNIDYKGTEFQKRVWDELCNIPFGSTISYKELALRIGNPNASRAVGFANSKNPIAIIVPCHRVIGQNGTLTGFAGGLTSKEFLLKLEGARNN